MTQKAESSGPGAAADRKLTCGLGLFDSTIPSVFISIMLPEILEDAECLKP
jgi:hypothetical protein